jgi:hypothetical protein
MNHLLYGNSLLLTPTPTTSILKSSGNRTPAPTSKVLRWKDLEAAAVEAVRTRMEGMPSGSVRSVRSVDGTEKGEEDEADGEGREGEEGRMGREYVREGKVEEMFV